MRTGSENMGTVRERGATTREGGDLMTIERVYEEGLVKEWHGNQI